MTDGARRFVGEVTFSALASEPVQTSLWDEAQPDPAHPARPGRRPGRRRPGHGPAAGRLPHGPVRRPAHRHAARHPGPGAGRPGDAHRDVGAPGGVRTTSRSCGPAGVHVVPPEEGRLAGGDVGAGRLADPAVIVAAGRARSSRATADATSPGCRCWSPPAAPASPSTRCASSATGRRASRATPSPRRPPPGAPRSRWSPPCTGPVSAGIEVVARRDRRRDARRRASAAPRRRRRRHGRRRGRLPPGRGRRPQDQEGAAACPRSCSSRPSTSSPRSARPSPPGRPSSASPPRPTSLRENAEAKLRAKGADLIVANECRRPGAGFEHDTNEVVILSADRAPSRSPWPTSGPSPERCSTPSSSIRNSAMRSTNQ